MRLKISGLQTEGTPADPQQNLHELRLAANNAKQVGSSLLITPELFVSGYDIGCEKLREIAELNWVGCIQGIARDSGIALLVGYPERGEDSELYNSAVFVEPNGNIAGVHRKAHLFGSLDRAVFSAGNKPFTLVEYRGFKIAILICYDVEFPETVRMAANAGADLIAVPTAQMEPYRVVADLVIRTRAWDNQVYVAYINRTGAEGNTVYVGCSSIVAPESSVIDHIEHGTDLIHAVLDKEVIASAQLRNPYLSDRRTDLYN